MGDSSSIFLCDLDYGPREEKAVLRVLRRKWLTMGEEAEAFESQFADFIGVKHAIAVSNCTAALQLANLAVGVGPGDEVICPSLSFVATANAILYAGAHPVFADVTSLGDWTLGPGDLEEKITPRTKAVTVMHYAGFACDMDAIMAIARRHQLAVIEDVAHAPGSEHGGRKLGAFGDVSCFSFFSNKNIATGEGGMICTDSDVHAETVRLHRSHCMTSATLDRHIGRSFSYDVLGCGFNYRRDEIHSALGRVQLEKQNDNKKKRQEAYSQYTERLAKLERLEIPFQTHEHSTNYHLFPVLLRSDVDREGLMGFLRERKIQTSIHYPPIHKLSFYRKKVETGALPLTEQIGMRELTLPMHALIGRSDIDRVVTGVREFLGE